MVNKQELIKNIINILKKYSKNNLEYYLNILPKVVKGGSGSQIPLCHNIQFPTREISRPDDKKLVYPSSIFKGKASDLMSKFKEFATEIYVLYKFITEKINPNTYNKPDFSYKYVCSDYQLLTTNFEVLQKLLVYPYSELQLIKDFLQELFIQKSKLKTVNFQIKEQKIYFIYNETEFYLVYNKHLNKIYIIMNIKKHPEQKVLGDFVDILEDTRSFSCPPCAPCAPSAKLFQFTTTGQPARVGFRLPTQQIQTPSLAPVVFSQPLGKTLNLSGFLKQDTKQPKTYDQIQIKYDNYANNINRSLEHKELLLDVYIDNYLNRFDFDYKYKELTNDDLLELWLSFIYIYKINLSNNEYYQIDYKFLYYYYSIFFNMLEEHKQNIKLYNKSVRIRHVDTPSTFGTKQRHADNYRKYLEDTQQISDQFSVNNKNILKLFTSAEDRLLSEKRELSIYHYHELLLKIIKYIIQNLCDLNKTNTGNLFEFDGKKYSLKNKPRSLFNPINSNIITRQMLFQHRESNEYYDIVRKLIDEYEKALEEYTKLTETLDKTYYGSVISIKKLIDDRPSSVPKASLDPINLANKTNKDLIQILLGTELLDTDNIEKQYEIFNEKLYELVKEDKLKNEIKKTGLTQAGFIVLCNIILFNLEYANIIKRFNDNQSNFTTSKLLLILNLIKGDYINQFLSISKLTRFYTILIVIKLLNYDIDTVKLKSLKSLKLESRPATENPNLLLENALIQRRELTDEKGKKGRFPSM
jgi:hypothetical protein